MMLLWILGAKTVISDILYLENKKYIEKQY